MSQSKTYAGETQLSFYNIQLFEIQEKYWFASFIDWQYFPVFADKPV